MKKFFMEKGFGISEFSGHVSSSYSFLLTSQGTGAGVGTLKMQVSSNITVTLGSNAKFYTNSAGTTGESATWNITSGALRTIYIKCTIGTASMTLSDVTKLTRWGGEDAGNEGWITANENCPKITASISKITTLTHLNLSGYSLLSDSAMPSSLTYLRLYNYLADTITWTSTSTLPSGLTYLNIWTGQVTLTTTYNPANLNYLLIYGSKINITFTGSFPNTMTVLDIDTTPSTITINGALPTSLVGLYILGSPNVTWSYTGALPSGLNTLYLKSGTINWTYSGALPSGMITVDINYILMNAGSHVYWTSTDALPSNLSYLELIHPDINWNYSGALNNAFGRLVLYGPNINYTGNFAGTGNFNYINLSDFRTTKMDDAAIITLLTDLTNRVGGFPATVTIGDYTNYASPPAGVTTAINAFKAAKSVTTVTLAA